MPIELQIIRASEFIRLGGQGEFDFAGSRAVLVELASACRRRGIDQALLDIREARSEMTPAELAALVHTFRDIGFTERQRLAVLHAGDPHHRARLFAFISNLRGWTVRAFGCFEEALSWLSDGESESAATHGEPVQVIKHPRPRNRHKNVSGGQTRTAETPGQEPAKTQDCFSE